MTNDIGGISIPTTTPTISLPIPYTVPGLVLYLDASVASSYPGTGTSWYNLAYIGNTATLTNGPTFNSSNGGIFLFDGSNDYAAPAISPLNAYPFTISIWITHSGSWNPGSEAADVLVNTSIAGQRVTAGIVNVAAWGPPAIIIAYGGTSHFTCPNPSTTGANNWHNITFVIYGSADTRHQIYVDGVAQTVTNRAGSHGGTAGWRIGASIDGEYWFGNIGVVQVYNTALSATDVTNLFNYHRSRFGI
jgi:hypothetical protein